MASVVRNNPNLKPETSRSATVGMVLEPFKGSTVSLDYWRIERKDEIRSKSTDDLLAAEADQPWPKANGEGFNLNFEEFGHGEMAELVDDDDNA